MHIFSDIHSYEQNIFFVKYILDIPKKKKKKSCRILLNNNCLKFTKCSRKIVGVPTQYLGNTILL